MAFWSRFTGSAGSQAVGVAIGSTAVPALFPAVQALENEAWQRYPTKPPTVYTVVQGVAQGQIDEADGRLWANQQGFSDHVFDALLAASDNGPAFGNLLDAYRRGLLDDGAFNTGLNRMAIEPRWWPALRSLKRQLLSPAEAANARQQGFISDAEQVQIAGEHGLTPDDALVQFQLAGLPPGVETGLQMWRRGIIDEATFAQIVREGHTKTKYTGALEQLRVQILSAATAVRAHLKGHITADQMHARGAQWGYSPADMDLWYESEGRPASVHQIHIGYARGGSLPGAANEQDAIRKSVAQSNIRPEYFDLLYAGRYSYPSAFVLRALVQSGAISRDEGEKALLYSGWEPTFAAKVAAAWSGAGAGAGAGDPHVGKAQTKLWTTAQTSYVNGEIGQADLADTWNVLGIPADAQTAILAALDEVRSLTRKQLTPAQVKKAWVEGVLNESTGGAWTRDEALAALMTRGYSASDANTFLEL